MEKVAVSVSPGPTIPLKDCLKAAQPFSHLGHYYAAWQAGVRAGPPPHSWISDLQLGLGAIMGASQLSFPLPCDGYAGLWVCPISHGARNI